MALFKTYMWFLEASKFNVFNSFKIKLKKIKKLKGSKITCTSKMQKFSVSKHLWFYSNLIFYKSGLSMHHVGR